MKDKPVTLDDRRGMSAQKATEQRRLGADVKADARALRERQDQLEAQLLAAPADTWPEAAGKARYLLGLLATTPIAQDPRRRRLIANVLEDFARLSRGGPETVQATDRKETDMAKGQQRSNREKRKPKVEKSKAPPAQTSPFAPAKGAKPGGKGR